MTRLQICSVLVMCHLKIIEMFLTFKLAYKVIIAYYLSIIINKLLITQSDSNMFLSLCVMTLSTSQNECNKNKKHNEPFNQQFSSDTVIKTETNTCTFGLKRKWNLYLNKLSLLKPNKWLYYSHHVVKLLRVDSLVSKWYNCVVRIIIYDDLNNISSSFMHAG